MRRKLFLLAVAAAALASCSSDETLSVNQGLEDANTISFRPAIQGMTRAANGTGLKTTPWELGDKLYVTAMRGTSKYFQDEFILDEVGFNSAAKHFWPTDMSGGNAISFTAFWGAEYFNWASAGDENKLRAAYTVPDAASGQKDLLFAKSQAYASKPDATGKVMLNFRHMLSQIVVKVANDQPNLNINITGVRVGYVAKTGEFNYNRSTDETNTDSHKDGSSGTDLIKPTDWNPTAPTGATQLHEQSVTATLNGATSATDLTSFSSWILMPQLLNAATGYTAAVASASATHVDPSTLNGAYLALRMSISENSVPIVADQWCYWPIDTEWKPGYKYTYTINAGSGGYQPSDQNNNQNDLDPVLDGLVIWFNPSCTIDAWYNNDIVVSAPAVSVEDDIAKGNTKTYNVAAGTFGTYTINVTGLAPNNYVILDPANNNNLNATGAATATLVPSSGKITLRCSLTANTTVAVTSSIKLKVYTDSGCTAEVTADETTITIVQAAP